MTQHPLYIGIDLGTSGVRACAITRETEILHLCQTDLPAPERDGPSVTQDARLWWQATQQVLSKLFQHIDPAEVQAIAVNGTSGTVLACDDEGMPLGKARMYNDAFCSEQAERISTIAPADCAALGSSSGLARLLYLEQHTPQASHYCHQADWIAGQLSGRFDISDENNALKSGYDPLQQKWPEWLDQLKLSRDKLPAVVPPGTPTGQLKSGLFSEHQLNPDCKIVSGTTDSIAAFIATGASQPGDAVTSLGSTLVLKVISEKPVFSAEYGIYSHKLGNFWLAGGASNSGGAVLAHYFSQQQMDALTPRLKPHKPTGLSYYPLLQAGERFPVCDANFAPQMEPKASSELETFQAMLEGIARIEADGYKKLQQLGANYPTQVETAGGGSKNTAWMEIRQNMLGVPVTQARYSDACYGSALLAMSTQ